MVVLRTLTSGSFSESDFVSLAPPVTLRLLSAVGTVTVVPLVLTWAFSVMVSIPAEQENQVSR